MTIDFRFKVRIVINDDGLLSAYLSGEFVLTLLSLRASMHGKMASQQQLFLRE
jgi:hypothetical protein